MESEQRIDESFRYGGVEDLVGRTVRATNGDIVGRIEELRVERRGVEHAVTQILIGVGAPLERVAVVNWFLPRHHRTRIARSDQIELEPCGDARLTVSIDELAVE